MNWIILSLVGTQLFTINYFLDKHISNNLVKNYKGMPIYGAMVGLLSGTFFWIVTGFPVLPLSDAAMLILAGMLTIFAANFYYAILSEVDASLAIILNRMESLFVLILSFLILKQNITAEQLIGFFIIFFSIILFSFIGKETKLNSLKLTTFLKFVICNFMWAICGILVNLAMQAKEFSHILSFESWGLGLGGIILFIFFPSIRNAFFEGPTKKGSTAYSAIFFNEILFVFAKACYYYAYSLGPAALVSIVGSTQVLSAVLYGIILTIIFPKSFHENISKQSIFVKFLWAVVIAIGMVLIS